MRQARHNQKNLKALLSYVDTVTKLLEDAQAELKKVYDDTEEAGKITRADGPILSEIWRLEAALKASKELKNFYKSKVN